MCNRCVSVFILFVSIICILTGCQNYSTKAVETYGDFRSDKYVIDLNLDVFPEQISDDIYNNYLFKYQSGFLDDHCQIFLDCTYSEDDYEEEISRIQKNYGGRFMLYEEPQYNTKSQIIYNDNWFNYPSYVASYVEGSKYEYALLFEDECRIVYVALQYCPISEVEFNHDYLPINYADFSHY